MSPVIRLCLLIKLVTVHLNVFHVILKIFKASPSWLSISKTKWRSAGRSSSDENNSICDRKLLCYELKRYVCRQKDLAIQTTI